jgi:ATP-dependent helicase/nuclease subunit A
MIDNLNKAQKGTDLHRLFESAKYLSKSSVDEKSTTDEKKALAWLFNLADVPFQKILNQGHAEWGFGLKTKLGTLQGQIDLWAKINNTVYILDYKTGSSFFSDKALLQLERYCECLKKMNFIQSADTIKLVVLYPFEEKIVIKEISYTQVSEL